MLAALLLAGALSNRVSVAAERAPLRSACEALSGMVIPADKIGLPTSGAQVESSRFISATTEGNVNGEYCEVMGWISPVSASSPRMQFEVNLPSRWNGKLLQMGGSAFDGILVTAAIKAPPALMDRSASTRRDCAIMAANR
jgi:feruloyl esterase